jgi:hypothetical protein
MAEEHAMRLELRAIVTTGGEAGARACKVGGLADNSGDDRRLDEG